MMKTSNNYKDLMNEDFDILRKNRTTTDSGGFEVTFSKIGTVTGRMSTVTSAGTERSIGGKLQVEISHTFYTLFNEDIQRDDLLEQVNGDLKVRVLQRKEPSEIQHHLEFPCQRLSKPSVPTS